MRVPGVTFFPIILALMAPGFAPRSCEREATPPPPRESRLDVIVILAEPPVADYHGGIPGYAATAPEPGRKIDFESEPVRRYQSYLAARQEALFQEIRKIEPSAERLDQQSVVTNTLTLRLRESAIEQVRKIAGVSRVERSKEYRPLRQ